LLTLSPPWIENKINKYKIYLFSLFHHISYVIQRVGYIYYISAFFIPLICQQSILVASVKTLLHAYMYIIKPHARADNYNKYQTHNTTYRSNVILFTIAEGCLKEHYGAGLTG
jgi:hypothetical protein